MVDGQKHKYTHEEMGVMAIIPRTLAFKLYYIFGENLELAKKWLATPNRHFKFRTPLEALESDPKATEQFVNRLMGQ